MAEKIDSKAKLEIIYERYNMLKAESKADCFWDKQKLDSAFNITMSLSKWINIKCEWDTLLRGYEAKRIKHYRELYEFYDIESPRKLTTKTEYDLFITSDPGYVDIYNLTCTVQEVVNYIKSVIAALTEKKWEVKTYIEYLKFINGR